MAQFRHVMFGHVLYEDGFSYQELLDAEDRIRTLLLDALSLCGAAHVDFDSEADATLVECAFPEISREDSRDFCETVVHKLGPGISARFLFMDRELSSLFCYFLGRGKWEEQAFTIPSPKEALSGLLIRRDHTPPARAARLLEAPAPEPEAPEIHPELDAERERAHADALRAMLELLNRK